MKPAIQLEHPNPQWWAIESTRAFIGAELNSDTTASTEWERIIKSFEEVKS